MIVPGSIYTTPVDHPFSWYAIVKERDTGKQWTYWFNGGSPTRESVALHIATYYRNVDVITIDRCMKMPERMLQPVPASHFQLGIFKAVEAALGSKIPLLSRKTINRSTIPRATIARR
jgi:hypothetical protein